jgi:hypothetical protein
MLEYVAGSVALASSINSFVVTASGVLLSCDGENPNLTSMLPVADGASASDQIAALGIS